MREIDNAHHLGALREVPDEARREAGRVAEALIAGIFAPDPAALTLPMVAVFPFLVAPLLQHNSFTTANVFLIFPAVMVLLLAAAAAGVAVTAARVARRFDRPRPSLPIPEATAGVPSWS